MKIVVFEDSLVSKLHPVTLARPAFAISCGGYQLVDLLPRLGHSISFFVRPHLRESVLFDYPLQELAGPLEGDYCFVNARLVPHIGLVAPILAAMRLSQPGYVGFHNSIAMAVVRFSQPKPWSGEPLEQLLNAEIETQQVPAWDLQLPLLEYPHDVIRYHTQIMADNLNDRVARGGYRQLQDGLFVGNHTEIGEFLNVDTRSGPVVIESHSRISPFCYLAGPVLVGTNAKLIEHTALKDNVALGHTTKVGGEVEASVIESYTNKQHHGFLGHSYLGNWVNLGAGTCNSDLKNTYGPVTMTYDGQRVPTGMQFMGCVIGDFSKTAVNTGIFTGKVIGVCSMVYGFVTTNVPSFTNYARLFGQMTEVLLEVAIATQQRMFSRRNVVQRPCDIQLIRDMYELTRRERQLGSEPLVL